MGVHEYRGEPGLGYLKLPCAHGTAPFTGLKPGDLVDFGDEKPPADGRWVEAAEGAEATRLPDNHPDNQPTVQWPEPEDAEPEDAAPAEETAPADDAAPETTSAEQPPADIAPTKRSKPAAKTA